MVCEEERRDFRVSWLRPGQFPLDCCACDQSRQNDPSQLGKFDLFLTPPPSRKKHVPYTAEASATQDDIGGIQTQLRKINVVILRTSAALVTTREFSLKGWDSGSPADKCAPGSSRRLA